MTVFRSLTGQVLHHQLSPAPSISNDNNELYDSQEREEEEIDAEFHLTFSELTKPRTGSKDSESDTDSDSDSDSNVETPRKTDDIELSPNQINVEILSTETSMSPSESNKETVNDRETHSRSTAV